MSIFNPTISISLCVEEYLLKEGFSRLIEDTSDFELAGGITQTEAKTSIISQKPSVIVWEVTEDKDLTSEIKLVRSYSPNTCILAISDPRDKEGYQDVLQNNINGYVLKDCSRQEITDAIYACSRQEQFFCGKILRELAAEKEEEKISSACEGLNISEREMEIIRLIAEGNTNKEIADMLFLSSHTVNTHRKNIMGKIGVNNTAGIVVFAVKENLISPNKYLFSGPGNKKEE